MMTRYFFSLAALFVHITLISQELTGTELLENSIAFHDPESNWKSFKGKMLIEMESANADLRSTVLDMDLPGNYFKSTVTKNNYKIESELNKGKCVLKLNGSTSIYPKIKDSLNISCDRAKMIKNYYTYLYGLPMKLKDPGTIIASKVIKKRFKRKEYLVLKATYEKKVGNDTWYFYFDPKNYAMEAYQFFHDEKKNDGEYILLSDIITVDKMKLPKVRAWYYNKDDAYLATDILRKAKVNH